MQIRIILTFVCLVSLSFIVKGQVRSPKDRFEVNAIRGCAPLTVTAVNTSGLDPSQYPIVWNMDWDGDETNIVVDENQSAAQADTTYATPGTYQILQVIGNQSDPIDTITVEVLPDNPPAFQVYNCINNSIYIDFSQDTVFDDLEIDFGDGNSTTLPVSSGSATYSYGAGGQYTVSVQGTFTNGGRSCSAYDTAITTINNLDIAQIEIVRVVGAQEIELAYDLEDPNIYYRLEVAENSGTDFSFASFDLDPESSVLTLSDTELDTRENYYCFRIVAVNRCDENLNQFSDTVCSILLEGTPEDLQNRLNWLTEGFNQFAVSRDGGGLASVSDTEYVDEDVVCQEEYLYTITAQTDEAISVSNQLTLTAIAENTPVALEVLDARLNGNSARLNWPGVPDAELYYIYRSEAGGPAILYDSIQASASQQFTFNDPQQLDYDVRYCYQVSYRDVCANESTLSDEACVVLPRQARVFFPNAFTPNGDGLNDIFVYEASLLTSVRFMVFNRWGELLFETDEIDAGWDGSYLGKAAPQGTYLYKMEVVDQLGNAFERTGNFTLLMSSP